MTYPPCSAPAKIVRGAVLTTFEAIEEKRPWGFRRDRSIKPHKEGYGDGRAWWHVWCIQDDKPGLRIVKRHSMHIPLSIRRIYQAAAVVPVLAIAISVAGYSQPSAPLSDIACFFHEIIGEWIGTVEQYADGTKSDTKYFHGVVKQISPDTYETLFEYYRLDEKTHAPVQVGVTSMTTKIALERAATNIITGKGDVFISPRNLKPEEYELSEVLYMSPTGGLEGKGSGKISVRGMALGLGKNGKVSDYTSKWALNNGVLSITEQLRVTFRVLFFAKHYNIVDDFKAKRGSDIMGLMNSGSSYGGGITRSTPKPSRPIRLPTSRLGASEIPSSTAYLRCSVPSKPTVHNRRNHESDTTTA
jgi:hypothetical protein